MAPPRHPLHRSDHRHRCAARLEGRRRQEADRRPGRAGEAAQGRRSSPATAGSSRSTRSRSRGRTASKKVVTFDQAIIAAGSEPVTLPFIPHRRPAGDRQHRGAGAGRHPEAAAGARRRHHRAGDGDGLPRAGREGDHRRADGPDHPRRRQGHRDAADEADPEEVREHPPEDQGDQGRGDRRTGWSAHFEGGKAPATDTFDRILVAVGRRPNGRTIGAENAGRGGGRARLHPGGQADADQRAAHLRHRRRGRAADAGAQGGPRGPGGGGGRGRQEQLLRRQGDPVGGLYRSGSRLGRADRERG